jgi:hypothetical protein
MRIRTKLCINACIFVAVVIYMAAREVMMRWPDLIGM